MTQSPVTSACVDEQISIIFAGNFHSDRRCDGAVHAFTSSSQTHFVSFSH